MLEPRPRWRVELEADLHRDLEKLTRLLGGKVGDVVEINGRPMREASVDDLRLAHRYVLEDIKMEEDARA